MRKVFGALLAVALLAGCARGHAGSAASSGPSASPVPVATATPLVVGGLAYPSGIVPPAGAAAAMRAGLYPSATASQCCFLARHALLVLAPPADAHLAVFTFYVPLVKPLLAHGERVDVAFDGVHAGSALLQPGEHNVTVTIPKRAASKKYLVASLTMSVAFVPKRIGLNPDIRLLSIMLLRVSYV